jgi:hypothetical protein
MAIHIRRREFIATLGGTAAAWPFGVRAQQPYQPKRIGVLMNLAADDAESQDRLAAFLQGLHQLGWIEGRNVRIYVRWGAGDVDSFRRYAAELVALAPASTVPMPVNTVVPPPRGEFGPQVARDRDRQSLQRSPQSRSVFC